MWAVRAVDQNKLGRIQGFELVHLCKAADGVPAREWRLAHRLQQRLQPLVAHGLPLKRGGQPPLLWRFVHVKHSIVIVVALVLIIAKSNRGVEDVLLQMLRLAMAHARKAGCITLGNSVALIIAGSVVLPAAKTTTAYAAITATSAAAASDSGGADDSMAFSERRAGEPCQPEVRSGGSSGPWREEMVCTVEGSKLRVVLFYLAFFWLISWMLAALC